MALNYQQPGSWLAKVGYTPQMGLRDLQASLPDWLLRYAAFQGGSQRSLPANWMPEAQGIGHIATAAEQRAASPLGIIGGMRESAILNPPANTLAGMSMQNLRNRATAELNSPFQQIGAMSIGGWLSWLNEGLRKGVPLSANGIPTNIQTPQQLMAEIAENGFKNIPNAGQSFANFRDWAARDQERSKIRNTGGVFSTMGLGQALPFAALGLAGGVLAGGASGLLGGKVVGSAPQIAGTGGGTGWAGLPGLSTGVDQASLAASLGAQGGAGGLSTAAAAPGLAAGAGGFAAPILDKSVAVPAAGSGGIGGLPPVPPGGGSILSGLGGGGAGDAQGGNMGIKDLLLGAGKDILGNVGGSLVQGALNDWLGSGSGTDAALKALNASNIARDFAAGGYRSVSTPGLVSLNVSPGRQANVDLLRNVYYSGALKSSRLRDMVQPGYGRLTQAALDSLNNQRTKTIGDLREMLGRRRILGSSFAADALTRAGLDFQQRENEIRANSFLGELELSNKLLQQETEQRAGSVLTSLNEMNLQAEAGAKLATNSQAALAQAAALQSSILADAADVRGTIWAPAISEIGNTVNATVQTIMGRIFGAV